ncbi:class I SAM-dependent methyltransferase [Granulicella sp. dw_53]|uniref:class I SAM-dependent methyltransferase n=1 Tax=Granulicella sp. dw_53 TaxID=2719792 RepID=UPI001BD442CF|nr:class I SAM-dependent methyltransferase [Granulicella sp. dw_53]
MSTSRAALPLGDVPGSAAGAAFDRIAVDYDRVFTDSLIGRAQREAVWKVLLSTFHRNDKVLELNCGTGEDALFLAGNGISVFACDASREMIARAEQRLRHEPQQSSVVFRQLPTEFLGELSGMQFDGAFSNFSGLNCTDDLGAVASSLASLVRPNGRVVLCLSTRYSLIEIFYYLALGQWKKASRRWKGYSEAKLDGAKFTVYYPTVRQIRRYFRDDFRLYSCTGIGVAVPPSYLEMWARKHSFLFGLLRRLEGFFSTLPIFRSTGDHVLLCFERIPR